MVNAGASTLSGAQLVQIAWVVKDIEMAQRFFKEAMGITNFGRLQNFRAQDFEGTYYGKPSEAEWRISAAYSGGLFVELIQPVSGRSIFQDYLDRNSGGGVHHLAYSLPIDELDKTIFHLGEQGFPIVTSVNMSIAKIVFFDTSSDIGVFTEVMGITQEGEIAVQKMKIGKY